MIKKKDKYASYEEAFSIINKIGNLLKKNNNINEIYDKYKIIFIKIKEKVGNNEEKINNFIESLINYYNIKNDLIIDEFNILFKSKKYEVEINSIIYFFKYFETNNEYWNKILPEEYQNLSTKDYPEIKRILLELRQNNIYNYQNMQDYNKLLFLCLYNKKEAMDFLISKTKEDLKVLKNKIELYNNIINIQDINDIEKCLGEINRMKQLRNNNKIFNYIKNMNYNIIEKFIKYSNIYMFIIEFDRNNYDLERTNKLVCDILKEASFNITQDKEEFIYIGNDNKERNISLEELVELKNKIYLIDKNEKIIFFKNLILNLENILKHIFILRNKGSNLPINIIIKINLKNDEPSAIYYLYDKKETLENIMVFLSNAEKAYLIELDIFYKNKMNLRFLYGKQFRNIIKHLENKSNINIDSLLRYILNNQNTNKHIKDEYKIKNIDVNDYINQYEMYYKTVFEEISQYISYIFNVNRKTIEEHYNNIKIKSEYIIKGIYLIVCKDISMEQFITELLIRIIEVPIAQGLLIVNEETSCEEIQSFLYRAILCNYNTLFAVEIKNSFSNFQLKIMMDYMNSLLTYKNKNYNEKSNKKVDIKNINEYLDSCIIFVYDRNNTEISKYLKKLKNMNVKFFQIFT